MFTRESVIRQGHYYLDAIDGSQHGAGDLTIEMQLHGYSAAGHEATPTKHAEALFLEAILGSIHVATRSSTDSISDAGSAVGTLDIDGSATMSHFAAGQARAIENTNGVINAAYVKQVTGTDLTLLNPLEATNAVDKPVLSSLNCFLGTTVAPKCFTFTWQSLQANSRLILEGCIPTSCTISLDVKAQPTISFTFTVNSITASTGSALSESSYTLPTIPPAIGANAARMMRGDAEIAVSGLNISIEQTLAPALDHNSSQGVKAMLCTGRKVEASFTELLDTTSGPVTATSGQSTDPLFLQIGTTAGIIFAMCMPKPLMMSVGDLGDSDGVIAQSRTYCPGNYTGDTSAGGLDPDPANSDFRVSFL
tara:strand:+ start:4632 stop:5726 length:1095 start_codon:yes stop_codon:yes gene_type:complete